MRWPDVSGLMVWLSHVNTDDQVYKTGKLYVNPEQILERYYEEVRAGVLDAKTVTIYCLAEEDYQILASPTGASGGAWCSVRYRVHPLNQWEVRGCAYKVSE